LAKIPSEICPNQYQSDSVISKKNKKKKIKKKKYYFLQQKIKLKKNLWLIKNKLFLGVQIFDKVIHWFNFGMAIPLVLKKK
jgi:hypothetical protein